VRSRAALALARVAVEARAYALHCLSMQQQRMVKFVEVRDFNNVYISELISGGGPILQRFKSLMSTLQTYYPELIHRAIIPFAPSTFSKVGGAPHHTPTHRTRRSDRVHHLTAAARVPPFTPWPAMTSWRPHCAAQVFALISSVLNERMQQKICVVPATAPFATVAEKFTPKALYSWAHAIDAGHDWNAEVKVNNGACEYTACWLDEGDALRWRVHLATGDDVGVYLYWMGNEGAPAVLHDARLAATEACSGSHVAPCSGVVWVCADNNASWWNAKGVRVTLDVDKKAGNGAADSTTAPPTDAPEQQQQQQQAKTPSMESVELN
jgi:hypothetical protein